MVEQAKNQLEQLFLSKTFMALWIMFVCLGAVILQFSGGEELSILQGILFFLIMIFFGVIQWFLSSLKEDHARVVLFVYLLLIFIASLLLPGGAFAIQVGLVPVWIAQHLTLSRTIYKPLILFILMFIIFYYVSSYLYESWLLNYIAIFILVLANIIPFSFITKRQIDAHEKMKQSLIDLEKSHQIVEKLTITNERQRMARNLHDTLAQGLVGLLFQLDAADAHLASQNVGRSHHIIQQAMNSARRTLKNARGAIDELRENPSHSRCLTDEINREIADFKALSSGLSITTDLEEVEEVSHMVIEHSIFMLRECLTNILKHSKAKKINIQLEKEYNGFSLKIEDNGIGLMIKQNRKRSGHYGLVGLIERAHLVNGQITFRSQQSGGTSIKITMPLHAYEGEMP